MEKQRRSRKSGSDPGIPDREQHEKRLAVRGFVRIAGVDEAGRGPLAGPVVAAAVILGPFRHPLIRDSKKLTPRQRALLHDLIMEKALAVGIGTIDHTVIDACNILNATRQAMVAAVAALTPVPDHLLIDALSLALDIPQTPLVRGDDLSVSIAAASIIAKVTRDRLMVGLHSMYPQYGFDRHKGYPTAEHRRLLTALGPCPVHRRSFAPVRHALADR